MSSYEYSPSPMCDECVWMPFDYVIVEERNHSEYGNVGQVMREDSEGMLLVAFGPNAFAEERVGLVRMDEAMNISARPRDRQNSCRWIPLDYVIIVKQNHAEYGNVGQVIREDSEGLMYIAFGPNALAEERVGFVRMDEAMNVSARPQPRNTRYGSLTVDLFQRLCDDWMQECLGQEASRDIVERRYRFLEEALELAQASGCRRSEAIDLVQYVFQRDCGTPTHEVGDVLLTLSTLAESLDIEIEDAARNVLERVGDNSQRIRAKHDARPRGSALPE